MKLNIVAIGNSRGIRLPKAVLQQCGIEDSVELEVANEAIVLHPCKSRPRQGWAEAFKRMAEKGEDRLLLDETVDADLPLEWQW